MQKQHDKRGRQSTHQQSQQRDKRPQQGHDLQRDKQGDHARQMQQGGDKDRQSGTGSQHRQTSGSGASDSPSGGSGSQSGGIGMSRDEHQRSPLQQGAGSTNQGGGNRQPGQDGGGKRDERTEQGDGREQNRQNVYGEGNYAASRQYNTATRDFAQSGRVDDAARKAAPRSDAEARQMEAAEAEGKRHSKGEDPALNRKASGVAPDASRAPKPGEEE
jgi:hypothetical protein